MRQIKQKRVIEYVNSNEMLRLAFKYYLEFNMGCNNPYHNVNHTMAMMDLLLDMGADDKNLDIMLLAAIFHDMNHSGGKMNDAHNVENAIDAYLAFTDKFGEEYFFPSVMSIIKATEFPYDESYKTNKMEQMVRECDNLVCFYDDFLTQVLLGLREEMHTTDLNELIDNELKFFDYSWSNLKLKFSNDLVRQYEDEIKNYLNEFRKTIA